MMRGTRKLKIAVALPPALVSRMRQAVRRGDASVTMSVAPLKSYTFPGGRVLTEFVQDVPWSGGPCYHIALRDQKGVVVAKSLWTDEELKNC